MNACFSLLIGLAALQANPAEAATPADDASSIAPATFDCGTEAASCGVAQPGDGWQASGCQCGCQQNGGVCTCNGCNHCNECEECDDDECKDPRDGGFCHCYCRSTCDMPPHFAYYPKYHGYYYFLPYNYSHVLRDIEAVRALNGDPRMPYSTAMFAAVYSEGVYEEAAGFNRVPTPFPTVSRTLPDLQQLLND